MVRRGSGTAAHLGREESFSKRDRLACVERLVRVVQRSFEPSILEGPVTLATDIQVCQATGSKQPISAFMCTLHLSPRLFKHPDQATDFFISSPNAGQAARHALARPPQPLLEHG